MLATLLLGAVAVGALTVVATALPGQPGAQRAAAVLGSALVVFAVLLLGAKVLLARPASVRALWPGAIVAAAVVTLVLNVGAAGSLVGRVAGRAARVSGGCGPGAGPLISWLTVGSGVGLGGPGIRRGVVAVRCPACAAQQRREGQQDHASGCHPDTSSGQDVQGIVHP